MTKIQSIVEELVQISEWFYDLEIDCNDINRMILERTKLTALLTSLTSEMVEQGRQKSMLKVAYKRKQAEWQLQFIKKGDTAKSAELKAIVQTAQEKEAFEVQQTYYFDLARIVESFFELDGALSQRIAYLREELKKTQMFGS